LEIVWSWIGIFLGISAVSEDTPNFGYTMCERHQTE
jgi:hypothetical protein